MGFPVPKVEKFRVPEGAHLGICSSIVDMGTQEMRWEDEVSWRRRVRITFELPQVRRQGTDDEGNDYDRPAVIGREVTQSFHANAALRKMLKSWGVLSDVEGSEEGLGALLGLPAMLTVVHEQGREDLYAKLEAITPIPHGMQSPEPETEPILFHIQQAPDDWDRLPEWMQERITESDEFKASALGHGPRSDEEVDSDLDSAGL